MSVTCTPILLMISGVLITMFNWLLKGLGKIRVVLRGKQIALMDCCTFPISKVVSDPMACTIWYSANPVPTAVMVSLKV